ncbi:ABC transporter substrate-binding protein [Mangrovihabitans endophyticus]|nr:ABC transporter substrate-binding protein [Mangrovihabitans endophyticus]
MRTWGGVDIIARRAVAGLTAVVLSACATGLLVACSEPADDGVDHLDVGIVPVIDVAPLYLGIDRGFFAAQRLKLTPKPSQAGATVTAAVVAGDEQIGFSNNTSLLIAASKGVPLRIVAAGNQAAGGDYAAIFARDDSGITAPSDLAGKRIAVNNLGNVGPLTVNAGLEASGVDISGVQFVEIPFPQMGAALTQRRIDAAWAVEPFASAIKQGGGVHVVMRPYPLIAAHFPVASYFTGTAYAKSDPDVVRRFRTAMNRSLTYAQNHPAEVRRILPSYIDLPPEVAAHVVLPEWSPDVGAPLLRRTADLARRYGYLTTEPDVARLTGG